VEISTVFGNALSHYSRRGERSSIGVPRDFTVIDYLETGLKVATLCTCRVFVGRMSLWNGKLGVGFTQARILAEEYKTIRSRYTLRFAELAGTKARRCIKDKIRINGYKYDDTRNRFCASLMHFMRFFSCRPVIGVRTTHGRADKGQRSVSHAELTKECQ